MKMRINPEAARRTSNQFHDLSAVDPVIDAAGHVLYPHRFDSYMHIGEAIDIYAPDAYKATGTAKPPMHTPSTPLTVEPAPLGHVSMTRELGERSYIGWWMRHEWRARARQIGYKRAASRLRDEGCGLVLTLMILVYPDNMGDNDDAYVLGLINERIA